MNLSSLACALVLTAPVAAHAGPADAAVPIDAAVQLRAADGKVTHDVRMTTVEHRCATSRAQDGPRSFDVELCHHRDTAEGRVVQIKWSLMDGKRVQRHDSWAVLAAGATVEVGATRGTGDTLIVAVR